MAEIYVIALLFALGAVMLVAELFIPSQGILTLAGLGFLVAGIVRTFDYGGTQAGNVSIIACMVLVPTFGVVAIKYWHRTPIGRRISPPNPVSLPTDSSVPVEALSRLIGQTGRSTTALRPVGICEFDGKRVSCIAQVGLIELGTAVEAVGMTGGNLEVREMKT